jgi:hypothetical protein
LPSHAQLVWCGSLKNTRPASPMSPAKLQGSTHG